MSLLGTGLWAMGQAMALSLALGQPWAPPAVESHGRQPAVAELRDHTTAACCRLHLPAGRQVLAARCASRSAGPSWPPTSASPTTPRCWPTAPTPSPSSPRCSPSATLDEWRERLEDFSGQWAVVQHTLEAAADPQTVANGYLQDCRPPTARRSSWWRRPCSTTSEPAAAGRAPEFNEHGDAILDELGLDWDTIVDLKVRGVVA